VSTDALSRHLARLDESEQAGVRARRAWGIRAGTALLAGVMAVTVLDGVGALDAVGVDTAEVSASADGTTLVVRYATVSRPALATPFEITVVRPGGFDGAPIELAVTTGYLELFDLNGVLPSPSEETADEGRQLWTFDPPDGDTFRVVYEARVEPAMQDARAGRVAVLGPAGEEAVAVSFETAIRP
jgi:hypothetical protein